MAAEEKGEVARRTSDKLSRGGSEMTSDVVVGGEVAACASARRAGVGDVPGDEPGDASVEKMSVARCGRWAKLGRRSHCKRAREPLREAGESTRCGKRAVQAMGKIPGVGVWGGGCAHVLAA